MTNTDADLELRVVELEHELARRDERIKELRAELVEAREVSDTMRQHVEDVNDNLDRWIAVLNLQINDSGVYVFDASQSEIWEMHSELLDRYSKLVAKWNRFVPQFNSTVLARDIGRPLSASDAQQAEVAKRRKRGQSIRAIASEMTLSIRTVRTIIEKATGADRASKRINELRKVEFNRQRVKLFRARSSSRAEIPKLATHLTKQGEALVKRAKGKAR